MGTRESEQTIDEEVLDRAKGIIGRSELNQSWVQWAWKAEEAGADVGEDGRFVSGAIRLAKQGIAQESNTQ